ncbi:Asp-tRNA(Asn)/Glu-tRNA(Gln) amidotransferase subunit GatA [Lentisphaerota bacterium WC36G]|nr:Asp-tRNA(Asn)/Glu-tRNA(Gln) amidotransferase subunit GatA [Lentisphaerae bacterium WC36]
MNKVDLKTLTLQKASDLLKSGEVSSVELCNMYLERVADVDSKVNSFLKVANDKVLAMAEDADKRRAENQSLSDYDGIPVGIKDCIVAEGETCSCASKILENVVSPYDSTAVKKLKAQGFIPFGRLNMDEFAMGSSTENSAYNKTSNPWDTERVPGGSSGGSAASVGASLIPASLGSDTGGSIRQPAAFCGVVGVKPSYGMVSRFGLVAFASSLDQIGPFAKDVTDAAIVLDAISGVDPNDSTTSPEEHPSLVEAVKNAPKDLNGLTVGLPKEYMEMAGLNPEVKAVVDKAIDQAKSLGATIKEVSLPHTKYAVATYYIIATAEASANLARFDGIRYGERVEDPKDLINTYFKSRGAGFGDEVKRRIILGTYVLSSGYYDAYYLRAQKVRTLIRNDFENAFKDCDVLLTPVTPDVAFKFGEKSDPLQMYLADIFTIALNLSGNCGLSLPYGFADDMPVGVQLIAPHFGEEVMFKTAKVLEDNREQKEFIASV